MDKKGRARMCAISPRALILCTTVLAAIPAGAQEAPQDEGIFTMLGRIVLGFGQPRVAIDTPQAVTVLEQEDLDRAQASTVRDVFDSVPGVQTVGSTSRPLGLAFNIRGIGMTEQPASEARIRVNVDGVPKFYEQYRMGSFFSDVELYKRVEVLRGPASGTLYGSGAIGGVVNFTTKDAADFLADGRSQALRFKLGYESNGDAGLASVIFARRVSESFEFLGNLNYRISGTVQDGDGEEVPGTDYAAPSGLLKGTWTLAGGQSLRLSLQHWVSDEDDAPYAQTGSDQFGNVDRIVTDTTATLVYSNEVPDSDWLDYTITLGFSDTTNEQVDSDAGIPSPLFADSAYGYRTFSLKAENRAELGGAGWDAYLTLGAELSRVDRSAEAASGPLGFHPEGRDDKLGLYAQSEFVLGERLTLIPGIRADFVDRTPGEAVPGGEEIRDTAISPKLAAIYKMTEEWSVFGSWAQTERLPTLDELYSSSATQGPALALDKEEAETFELGFSYSREGVLSEGDALSFKVTGFRNDVENLIQRTAAAQPLYYENVGAARFEGIEVEGGYEADFGYARLAYSHVRGTDLDNDFMLSSTPADALVLTLAHRMPDRGLEVGWTGHFVDSITTSSRSTMTGVVTATDYPAYSVHDLFLAWTPSATTEVRLGVENIFDTTYRNNLEQENGLGRNFKLTLTRTF